MNQITIGKFLAQRRKEKNITQEQLAEKLLVSNKTISKWETGKSMPDYQVIQLLCRELDITISELLEGKAADQKSDCLADSQMLDMLNRILTLENQKDLLLGILLTAIGILFYVLSRFLHGSPMRDLMAGILLGLSIGEILIGVYITARNIHK